MNIPRYAVAAARVLKRSAEHVVRHEGDRARGLATIERAMAARIQRRRALWSVGIAAAAAASFLGWQGGSRDQPSLGDGAQIQVAPSGSGTRVWSDGGEIAVLAPTTIAPGTTVVTGPDGSAALRLATRSFVRLSSGTELRVEGNDKTSRFALRRGGISANVSKLSEGRRFIVVTPDAEVEVRGTEFALQVLEQPQACGSGSRTRLAVSEGVVEVRASGTVNRVTAGHGWPVDCDSLGQSPYGPASEATPAAEPVAATPGKASVRRAPAASSVPAAQSALTQQNDLFASGVALGRQGNVAGALRAYQDLIAHFPNSPLAENAMVERMRLLATTQRPLAEAEARRYLQRYPRGFARDEAQRLTEEP